MGWGFKKAKPAVTDAAPEQPQLQSAITEVDYDVEPEPGIEELNEWETHSHYTYPPYYWW